MHLRSVLLGALCVGLPLCAEAQPIQGPYVSAGAGATISQNVRARQSSSPAIKYDFQENLGYDLNGSVGYAFGSGWRVELEGDYLKNNLQELGGGRVPLPGSGHLRSYGVMANALYDFDIRSRYVFPYLGFGLGYMWSRLTGGFAAPGTVIQTNSGSSSGAFAWQAIAGLSFPIPHVPGLSLLTQYRFLDITAGEEFDQRTELSGGRSEPSRLKLGTQFSHTFLIGLRYAFNVTPPPPPLAPAPIAAPAPAPARSYLVFFDWDRATLTTRAREIVRAAAEASMGEQYTAIRVNGYTDRSGSQSYNQALSMRRAENVAVELVRDGVPRGAIVIRGFGETHPLVQTAPGVRQPQNRRVEIIIE